MAALRPIFLLMQDISDVVGVCCQCLLGSGRRLQAHSWRLHSIGYVPHNIENSDRRAQLFVFEDTEAVIRMIIKSRTPNLRVTSPQHIVSIWICYLRENKCVRKLLEPRSFSQSGCKAKDARRLQELLATECPTVRNGSLVITIDSGASLERHFKQPSASICFLWEFIKLKEFQYKKFGESKKQSGMSTLSWRNQAVLVSVNVHGKTKDAPRLLMIPATDCPAVWVQLPRRVFHQTVVLWKASCMAIFFAAPWWERKVEEILQHS